MREKTSVKDELQRRKRRRVSVPDRLPDIGYLDRLPDDVLINIVDRLKLNDAAKTCVLSKRFRTVWESVLMYKQNLNFRHFFGKSRDKFEEFVNHVLSKHEGSSVQSLRIFARDEYDEYPSFEKWLEFARTKLVANLRLLWIQRHGSPFVIPSTSFLHETWDNLTSLSLTHVEVRDGDVEEWFKTGLVNLESLSIESATNLNSLIVTNSPKLKRLEIGNCKKLEIIAIVSAPNLQYFRIADQKHSSCPDVMFEEVPKLSHVELRFTRGFDSQRHLLEKANQVENLELLLTDSSRFEHFPLLQNLKKLCLTVSGSEEINYLLPIVFSTILPACPKLRGLTLTASTREHPSDWCGSEEAQSLAKSRAHQCLKVVEFFCQPNIYMVGSDPNVEICADFIRQIAPNLEKFTCT